MANIFKDEISFLEKEADKVLIQIRYQEQYMNEQNKNVDHYNLQKLTDLVDKILRIFSVIDTYKIFREKNEEITDQNTQSFISTAEKCYNERFKLFKDHITQ